MAQKKKAATKPATVKDRLEFDKKAWAKVNPKVLKGKK